MKEKKSKDRRLGMLGEGREGWLWLASIDK